MKLKKILFGVLAIVASAMLSVGITACNTSGANSSLVNGSETESSSENSNESSDTSKNENGLCFKTLTLNGLEAYGKVSNDTEVFSFVNEITVVGSTKFVVSLDVYGMQNVVSKTIPLKIGDNTVYVVEMIDSEPINVYTVVLRRRPMYEVTFNPNGGTAVDSQTIEEDSCASVPVTTRVGYTFDRWNFDFATPITGNTTIEAEWTANKNTLYKVEYYLQNLENDEYTLQSDETENKTGTTDTTATAEAKTFDHFTYKASSTDSGNINADGTTVLRVYYTRDTYTVTFDGNGGTPQSGNTTQTVKYGGTAVAPTYAKTGYSVDTWDKPLTNISEDQTITAQWKINQYTLTIVFGNGEEDKTFTQDYNTPIEYTLPTDLERVGYDFGGWYSSLPTTMPAENKTISARWLAVFERSNGKITGFTTYGKNNITELKIPSEIDGEKITAIGESAFSGCSSLTSIEIPDSVTSIGWSAFYNCSSLTSVYYNGTIDDWVQILFEYVYANPLYYAKNFYINNELVAEAKITTATKISVYAFYKCSSLMSVVIPDSVTSIGSSAFEDCSGLTSVTIPDSVTSIGGRAFSGCSSLTSVIILDSVTRIGEDAFSGCSSLEYTIKDGLKYLGNANNPYVLLMGTETTDITTATIADACKFIGSRAFSYCSSLTSVVIPDSMTSIGGKAFSGCSSLTCVVIGNSVTSIGYFAFWDCSSLLEVYYNGTESKWMKISIDHSSVDNFSGNYNLVGATRYYYSDEEPTEEGNYWHYVDGVVTKW